MLHTKIKILYVITQSEWGGAQRYVFDLATNLGPEFEVTVAVGEPSGGRDLQHKLTINNEQLTKKIKIVQLKYLVRNISLWDDIRAVWELRKLYKNFGPGIVHLNSSKAGVIGSYAARRLPKALRPHIVYTVHGWVFDEPLASWRQALYRYLEKSTALDKSAIITLSKHDAERGTTIGIPKEKIHLVQNGINPLADGKANLLPNADPLNQLPKIYFGTIANLYKTKGIDVLIKAVAKAKIKLHNSLFLIYGDGPEKKYIQKLIAEYNLGANIFLKGQTENAAQFLTKFSTFVLPSRKEGLPYVLLEALRAHVPIIATRVGGIPELIENKKSGLLVQPDSIEELSEALVWAAEHPEKMKELAKNAPPLPSLAEMINKTTSLYRSFQVQP